MVSLAKEYHITFQFVYHYSQPPGLDYHWNLGDNMRLSLRHTRKTEFGHINRITMCPMGPYTD